MILRSTRASTSGTIPFRLPIGTCRFSGLRRLGQVCAWLLALNASAAFAEACDGLAMPLQRADRAALSAEIAKQLHVGSVSIEQSYGNTDWSFFFVVTSESDQTFVIYAGDPTTTRYAALWGSAAQDYTDAQILEWAHSNAAGIPEPLAQCLSWATRQERAP